MEKDQPAASEEVRKLCDRYLALSSDIVRGHQQSMDMVQACFAQKVQTAYVLEEEATNEFHAASKALWDNFTKEMVDHGDAWMKAVRELTAKEGEGK